MRFDLKAADNDVQFGVSRRYQKTDSISFSKSTFSARLAVKTLLILNLWQLALRKTTKQLCPVRLAGGFGFVRTQKERRQVNRLDEELQDPVIMKEGELFFSCPADTRKTAAVVTVYHNQITAGSVHSSPAGSARRPACIRHFGKTK